jgi:hypothetical protein
MTCNPHCHHVWSCSRVEADDGTAVLGAHLAVLSSLQNLRLSHINLSADGAAALGPNLAAFCRAWP